MALLAMCFHNHDKEHTLYSQITYETLLDSVDLSRHRLGVFDNASTDKGTGDLLDLIQRNGHFVYRSIKNIGTAAGINRIWRLRSAGEPVCKMDNDWEFPEGVCGRGWLDEALEVFERDPSIGIVGLKRTDLLDAPEGVVRWNKGNERYPTQVRMLPQPTPLSRWMVVEHAAHVIGTCQVYNPRLIDKIGYLYQPGLYGFDDSLAAVRANLAGFSSVFLPHRTIQHLDPGKSNFQIWKERHVQENYGQYFRLREQYESGERDIYYDGGF